MERADPDVQLDYHGPSRCHEHMVPYAGYPLVECPCRECKQMRAAEAPARLDQQARQADALRRAYQELLFSRALWVPGVLHIMHTACGNLTDSLQYFAARFKSQLQTIMGFFKHQHLRELFITACLAHPARFEFRRYFQVWPVSWAEWRWSSLVECLTHIHSLKLMIRHCWDTEAMRKASRKRKEEEGQERERQREAEADGARQHRQS